MRKPGVGSIKPGGRGVKVVWLRVGWKVPACVVLNGASSIWLRAVGLTARTTSHHCAELVGYGGKA